MLVPFRCRLPLLDFLPLFCSVWCALCTPADLLVPMLDGSYDSVVVLRCLLLLLILMMLLLMRLIVLPAGTVGIPVLLFWSRFVTACRCRILFFYDGCSVLGVRNVTVTLRAVQILGFSHVTDGLRCWLLLVDALRATLRFRVSLGR